MASAAGGLAGALLHGWARNPWLTVVFAALLTFTGVSQLLGWSERMRFRGAAAWGAGALSGFLGGLVGNQGGIRSAALLGFDLRREVFVSTATAIGLIVDGARMPWYIWSQGEEMAGQAPWIAIATAGVVVGTLAGGRVLARIPEMRFRRVIGVLVGMLGLLMFGRAAADAGLWPGA